MCKIETWILEKFQYTSKKLHLSLACLVVSFISETTCQTGSFDIP